MYIKYDLLQYEPPTSMIYHKLIGSVLVLLLATSLCGPLGILYLKGIKLLCRHSRLRSNSKVLRIQFSYIWN